MIIKVKNLTKKFDEKVVLNDVNLNIEKGTITGIIGRNGSGKTVLLKIIAGLYIPTSGSVEIMQNLKIQNDFGFLIDTVFMENKTGFQNLYNISLIKNVITKNDIYNVMNYVGLDPFNKIKYQKYSTGMKQKLKIAQAIMENPKVIVLDEPFNGLDKSSVLYFRNELKKMKQKGTTIIITSHYQEDIDDLCDSVYEMDGGTLSKYEKN